MAINLSATAFYNFLIEIVGYKCGIALTRAELRQILIENQYAEYAFRHVACPYEVVRFQS